MLCQSTHLWVLEQWKLTDDSGSRGLIQCGVCVINGIRISAGMKFFGLDTNTIEELTLTALLNAAIALAGQHSPLPLPHSVALQV